MVLFRIEVVVNLQRLFNPDSIAVIGASQNEGKIGYEAMANATAFNGSVYPVNPSSSGMVFGESFVASVTEIDDTVDLALLCVPGPVVPDVLEECGEADVGGAVIYAGGFAEAGEEGERLQERTVEVATEHDIALLGPNTSGFVVPSEELFASFASGVERIRAGNVAVIAQSGGVAHVLAFQARREHYGLSGMVGLGNRANVGFQEVVSYFDADERTDAILLHVEGTDDGRGVLETCRDAETPVVAYKVGKTDVGDFAESHTGALTGKHDLYMAGFEQYGVLTVESTSELIDAGVALGRSPDPSGLNIGVVTAQAGPGIIIADRIQRAGGKLPELTAATQERLEELLPGITYAGNPVDTGRPMPEFGEVVSTVAADEQVDIVLVFELFEEALGFPLDTLDGLAKDVDKPVLFVTDGIEEGMADDLASLRAANVPVFTSPERGAEAAALLAEYAVLSDATDRTEVNANV
ncbi:CoA-binding protein [Haladaptatus sp. CMAA 1911]|uniref:CoA-binding protein n=1 Tax=unclassified Haladaptatus TaxID=2622732 RepID=UPI003754B13D